MCYAIILPLESADYIAQSVNVVFNAGNMDNMLCVNIPIIDDLLCEGIETFGASLTAGQNTGLATPAVATVTITDNDGIYVF